MSKIQTPYRYDFVGSFLRPQAVERGKECVSEWRTAKRRV